jgi:outer membrane lipoprotein-sorting protein
MFFREERLMTVRRPLAGLFSVALVAAVVLAGARSADSAAALPAIEADVLVASTLEALHASPTVAGELDATVGLGLPDLPDDGDADGLAELLGTNRLRVERSPDGLRLALLGARSERVFVTDGDSATLWDSRSLEVTRYRLPDAAGHAHPARPAMLDPLTAAGALLDAASRHGEVRVDGSARVAGRAAYRLAVVPHSAGTTVGRAELDVDAETRLPLRIALFADGADAASIELAWTRVSFAPVDAATFSFTPPPGATVTERELHAPSGETAAPPLPPGSRIIGEGLDAVALLPVGEAPDELAAVLPLNGPLLSARLAPLRDRTVLLAGLVPLSRLDEVAAELR